MDDYLHDVVGKSLLDFSTSEGFDVVDAEGLIYTIQPTSAWILKTASCLKREGFLIVSYMELYGGFIELLLKALYQAVVRSRAHAPGVDTAKLLFLPKWNSIPHTRTIDSWFMDVIANPFVRMKYYLDPADLLRQAHFGGFRLYSSWPTYRDSLAMHWIKAPYSEKSDLHAAVSVIEQSRLSHFLGSTCFLPMQSPELTASLRSLTGIVDALIDEDSVERCAEAVEHTDSVLSLLRSISPVASSDELMRAAAILSMMRNAFEVLGEGDVGALVAFCRTDHAFITTWGMPNHFGVFQRTSEGK